jgi:hypothetical protein
MRNPNFASLAAVRVEVSESTPISLDEFSFSDITWKFPDVSHKNDLPEAEVKIQIADKLYCCKLKRWTGHVIQEINFELFEDKNFEECLLEGTIQFCMDTETTNTLARASIKRKQNEDKENPALPPNTGIAFYKKILDFIRDKSTSYTHGLLHRVVHDPREGLTSEKWDKTFEPVLEDRGYQKIKQGRWEHLYKNADRGSEK